MADKRLKVDSRRIWERVLSSIPHGIRIRSISFSGGEAPAEEESLDTPEPIPEPSTPGPFGLE